MLPVQNGQLTLWVARLRKQPSLINYSTLHLPFSFPANNMPSVFNDHINPGSIYHFQFITLTALRTYDSLNGWELKGEQTLRKRPRRTPSTRTDTHIFQLLLLPGFFPVIIVTRFSFLSVYGGYRILWREQRKSRWEQWQFAKDQQTEQQNQRRHYSLVHSFHRLFLHQTTSFVRECVKTEFAVIRSDSTVSNSAKRQRFHWKTQSCQR